MSNKLRNEVAVTLGGKEYMMRASFSAISGIEQALGRSVVAIVRGMARQDFSATEIAKIIFHGLRGADPKSMAYEEVGDAVIQEGVSNLASPVMDLLGIALEGVRVEGKPVEEAVAQ